MKALFRHRVARHVLFWAAVSVFFALIQGTTNAVGGTRFYVVREYFFTLLPTFLLTTYPLLYGLLPGLLGPRPRPLLVLLLPAWAVAGGLLAGLMRALYTVVLAPALFGQLPGRPFAWKEYLGLVSFNFVALLVVAGGASAIKVFNGWHAQQELSQRLLQRKAQAELQLLKAQLQPPFLFNTLRTLHTLTLHKSPASPGAVLQLSALLRYMLYESPLDAVPLADEVAMMRDYVALEKLRVGSHVDVSLNFTGPLTAHLVAPLLLLPFIENAFRHGTGLAVECPWVSIDLVAKHHSLAFKVINSRAETSAAFAEGRGLVSIRQRLAHLYPTQHELKLIPEADTFTIVLHLRLTPAHTAPAGPAPRLTPESTP